MSDIQNKENNIPANEETKSGNWFVNKILKPFGQYLKNVGYDLKRDISENVNIIWFLLIALPGIFIGLFLSQHINAAKALTEEYSWSGFEIFIMELAGCLNIVWGFNVMKKKNLKSVIFALVTTAIIDICGILWVVNFFSCETVFTSENLFISDAILSIVCILISVVAPTIGSIAAIFTRDKKYNKKANL